MSYSNIGDNNKTFDILSLWLGRVRVVLLSLHLPAIQTLTMLNEFVSWSCDVYKHYAFVPKSGVKLAENLIFNNSIFCQ